MVPVKVEHELAYVDVRARQLRGLAELRFAHIARIGRERNESVPQTTKSSGLPISPIGHARRMPCPAGPVFFRARVVIVLDHTGRREVGGQPQRAARRLVHLVDVLDADAVADPLRRRRVAFPITQNRKPCATDAGSVTL